MKQYLSETATRPKGGSRAIALLFGAALAVLALGFAGAFGPMAATHAYAADEAELAAADVSIGDADAFVAFAANVTNGTTYAGQTVELTADIDLSGVSFAGIGTSAHPFAGTFDGKDFTISGLAISSTSGYAALFAKTTATATVKDFTVKGSVKSTTSGDYVAGVVAYNMGAVSGVTSSLAVTAGSAYNVGGIAGFNDGGYNAAVSTAATGGLGSISACKVTSSVTGCQKVGGIAGENAGTVSQCVATGKVDGTNSSSKNGVGGIVGRNGNNNAALEYGVVDSCYFTGTVGRSGQKWVGGIAGFCAGKYGNTSAQPCEVTNCYMAGTLVAGSGRYNAIVGIPDDGNCVVSNNYSLSGISNSGSSTSEIGTVVTADQMKDSSFPATLGSAYKADYTVQINAGYPILSWQPVAGFARAGSQNPDEDAVDIATAKIEITDAEGIVYTGAPVTPEVTVSLDDKTLAEGADYVLFYADNVAVGTATVTVEGIGSYEGTQDVQFAIKLPAEKRAAVQIAGSGRYDTMAKIVKKAYPNGSDGAILVTGENFPDALAASSLAGACGWPIVLTDGASLSEQSSELIAWLAGQRDADGALDDFRVLIVGGESAVSNDVLAAVNDIVAGKVQRIAGENRYETADMVYAFIADAGTAEEGEDAVESSWSKTAIIAKGGDFADALAVSGYAFRTKSPIFLFDDEDGLTEAAQSALKTAGFEEVIILGGEAAVPESVDAWVQENVGVKANRLQGENRYETSKAIAEFAVESGACSANGACIATGDDFPDALAGGALVGTFGTVLLLADEGSYDSFDVLKDAGVEQIYFLGGDNAVTPTVQAAAKEAAGLE